MGVSMLRVVVSPLSLSPLISTLDSTRILTFSPSSDSGFAVDSAVDGRLGAVSSKVACRDALASRADAASASFVAFVALGFFVDALAGLVFFAGEVPLGLPLDFGVEARAVVPFGGGRMVLSLDVNENFGGGEMAFIVGSSVPREIGASSRRACIHGTIP